MQRILSLEASRSGPLTSEFVTKRLCCSFILTVAFFGLLAGFILGRFAGNKESPEMRRNEEIKTNLFLLDANIKKTFQYVANFKNYTQVNLLASCPYLLTNSTIPTINPILTTLDQLNGCFNNG